MEIKYFFIVSAVHSIVFSCDWTKSACVKSGEGKRCFVHCNKKKTWSDADKFCQKIKGGLASGDTEQARKALVELNTRGSEEVWLGGRTRPLYWHWLQGSGEGSKTSIFYQGCYKTTNNNRIQLKGPTHTLAATSGSECRQSCQQLEYPFFSLKTEAPSNTSDVDLLQCTCRTSFAHMLPSEDCFVCSGDYACGSGLSESVYAATNDTHNAWENGEPRGLGSSTGHYCITLRKTISDTFVWTTNSCKVNSTNQIDSICVANKNEHMLCTYSVNGKCWKRIQSASWEEHILECERLNMSMVILPTAEDEKYLKFIIPERPYWIGASSLQWSWPSRNGLIHEISVRSDIWESKKKPHPFENSCLAVNGSTWISRDCSQNMTFFCERKYDPKTTRKPSIKLGKPTDIPSTSGRNKSKVVLYIGLGAGVLLVALIILALVKRHWKKKKDKLTINIPPTCPTCRSNSVKMVELPEDVYKAAISPRESKGDEEDGDEDDMQMSLADTIRLLALEKDQDVMDPSEEPVGPFPRKSSRWLSDSQESLAAIPEEAEEHEGHNTPLLKSNSLNNFVDNGSTIESVPDMSQKINHPNGIVVTASIENDVLASLPNSNYNEGSIEFIDKISSEGSKMDVSVHKDTIMV